MPRESHSHPFILTAVLRASSDDKKVKTHMKYKSLVVALLTGAILSPLLLTFSSVLGQVTTENVNRAEEVRVNYARAAMHLADIELRIALAANERIANLHSPSTIRRLRNNVAHTEQQLRYELHEEKNGLHDLHLQELETELEVAESELAEALELNRRRPDSYDALQIEKLRAAKEVARFALDLARDPTVIQSHSDHLQWQLNRMRSEVTRLYVLMDKALARN